MLTPQQIQEIRFEKAVFGGYDMTSVDDVLEPLSEDYIALYKENSVLKSKMRILVEKLEEYRRQETSMQNAIVAAQKTCDQMLEETEKKCAKMLHEAEELAEAKAQNIDALVDGEKERLETAKLAAAQFIHGIEKRLKRQLELLEELRQAELADVKLPTRAPAFGKPVSEAQVDKKAFDFDKNPSAPTTQERADALIEEIGHKMEEGLLDDIPDRSGPAQGPLPPETVKRFEDLQFGPGYDPRK